MILRGTREAKAPDEGATVHELLEAVAKLGEQVELAWAQVLRLKTRHGAEWQTTVGLTGNPLTIEDLARIRKVR
jgi:hypothetical protein